MNEGDLIFSHGINHIIKTIKKYIVEVNLTGISAGFSQTKVTKFDDIIEVDKKMATRNITMNVSIQMNVLNSINHLTKISKNRIKESGTAHSSAVSEEIRLIYFTGRFSDIFCTYFLATCSSNNPEWLFLSILSRLPN